MNRLWVVEMRHSTEKHHRPWRWHSTVGVSLSRKEGQRELQTWCKQNPCDSFRLVMYCPRNTQ